MTTRNEQVGGKVQNSTFALVVEPATLDRLCPLSMEGGWAFHKEQGSGLHLAHLQTDGQIARNANCVFRLDEMH